LEEFGVMSATRAFRIPEVCKATGLCRTTVYAAIKSGDLPARKYGRCTVILAVDLERFLNELPTTCVSRAKQQDDDSGGDEDDRKDRNSMSVARA
jgi:excisionase family DNA binding protein